MLILLNSFPAPQNTQATVIPLIVAYLSPQPFYIILIYQFIRRKWFKKKPPIRHISVDTLSKTTRQQSEPEVEPINDPTQIRKSSVVASSPISEPIEN